MAIGAYLGVGLVWEPAAEHPWLSSARTMLLPGATTHGHHQIELACATCHTSPFGGSGVMQDACTSCHAEALKEGDDKHPASKFNDPRNAFRLARIDAQQCITCHVEHRPVMTAAMGVTQPGDFCFHCHSGPEEMPPDHEGFAFDGCTAAGCHNYHDNRALYEDFLLKHGEAPDLLDPRVVMERGLSEALQNMMAYPHGRFPFEPLDAARIDAPDPRGVHPDVRTDWLASAHAKAGVNCTGCHEAGASVPEGGEMPKNAGEWIARPSTPQACQGCHAEEVRGFQAGKHGMRLAAGLSPMTPGKARLPMHEDAAHRELTCNSCHMPHRYDTAQAGVQPCLGCHQDPHSQAYLGSPHHELWLKERRGELPPGSGVTCATCHMPRVRIATEEGSRPGVQHNQNDTLEPNEKMIRPVCMSCHGLPFAIDALADDLLIGSNFKGRPRAHVRSIDMAFEKEKARLRGGAPPAAEAAPSTASPP